MIAGLVVLATLALSSIFYLQNQVQEQSFDIRPQAVNPQGQVDVSVRPSTTQFVTGQPAALLVSADTHGVQVKEIQLVFQVVTGTTGDLVAELLPAARLRATTFEAQRVSDGFLVKFVGQPISGNFSTNGVTDVLRVSLTPRQTGSIIFDADAENSRAFVANASPDRDELRPIARQTYQVAQGTATPTPTPTPSPSSSPSPSASPTPTPIIDISTCGTRCNTNAQCATGFRCFDGQCRLATNVTSSICALPGDQGLQRSCNEYCADSRECRSGYVCQENRCRHPQNVASATCAPPTVQIITTIANTCNQLCSNNDQCGLNMRCFGGVCRLASNPSSLSCSPAYAPTVSVIYEIPSTPKGGNFENEPTSSTAPTPSSLATGAGTLSPTPSPSPSPFASLQPIPSTVGSSSNEPNSSQSALDDIWSAIQALPQWLVLAIVGLASLFLVFLLLSFLSGPSARSTVPTRPTLRRDEKLVALERRIQDLQKPPATLHVQPAAATTAVTSAPISSTPTTALAPQPPHSLVATQTTPAAAPDQHPHPGQTVTATFRPSMTQQLRDKGVV